jgi:hypothetical protein
MLYQTKTLLQTQSGESCVDVGDKYKKGGREMSMHTTFMYRMLDKARLEECKEV